MINNMLPVLTSLELVGSYKRYENNKGALNICLSWNVNTFVDYLGALIYGWKQTQP